MNAEEEEATSLQNTEAEKPHVAKRTSVPGPGNAAKAAVTAARPKDAKPGSSPCPYCKEWLPFYHQENYMKMPYDIWIQVTSNA